PGSIAQTFPACVGQTYHVWFDMAGSPLGGETVKDLRVQAAETAADFSFATAGLTVANMGWKSLMFAFTASDPEVTLAFDSLDGNLSAGPALDNVQVVVPRIRAGFDHDADVDELDSAHLQACLTEPGELPVAGCEDADLDFNSVIDDADLALLMNCF